MGGKKRDVLNIIGIVAHAQTSLENSRNLSQEFTELLPPPLFIEPENSFSTLEFTAEWAELVAKYIIGIAAAVSLDFDYAKELFSEVGKSLSRKDAGFLIYEKLKTRTAIHLKAIASIRAQRELLKWRDTKDEMYLNSMGQFLADAPRDIAQKFCG